MENFRGEEDFEEALEETLGGCGPTGQYPDRQGSAQLGPVHMEHEAMGRATLIREDWGCGRGSTEVGSREAIRPSGQLGSWPTHPPPIHLEPFGWGWSSGCSRFIRSTSSHWKQEESVNKGQASSVTDEEITAQERFDEALKGDGRVLRGQEGIARQR